jgi:hypothetical protein
MLGLTPYTKKVTEVTVKSVIATDILAEVPETSEVG